MLLLIFFGIRILTCLLGFAVALVLLVQPRHWKRPALPLLLLLGSWTVGASYHLNDPNPLRDEVLLAIGVLMFVALFAVSWRRERILAELSVSAADPDLTEKTR